MSPESLKINSQGQAASSRQTTQEGYIQTYLWHTYKEWLAGLTDITPSQVVVIPIQSPVPEITSPKETTPTPHDDRKAAYYGH